MIFGAPPLAGVFRIQPERVEDERGWFARVFCVEEFRKDGLRTEVYQSSVSFNAAAGTLRACTGRRPPW